MRSVRIATWTSGEPVSPDFLPNVLMTSALRSGAIDIVYRLLTAGTADQPGQVEHALGDDFAAVDLGEGQKLARDRDMDRAAENRSIPSAQQNGLASLQPGRICPTD